MTGRRSFMWKMGTAMSAALAAAVPGMSKGRVDSGSDSEKDRLSRRLGILEDENSIRKLQQTYETCLDGGQYEQVVDLFADNGTVVFNGGIFEGRKGGIARLYCGGFRSGSAGKKLGPVPGIQADAELRSEIIEVAKDRLSAIARFPYTMQVGTPMPLESQLVQMARLHGEGIMKWCEDGICEMSYVKDTRDGSWKIQRLEYRVLSQTDYRPGRSYASPISIPQFSLRYPEDPAGPDKLT